MRTLEVYTRVVTRPIAASSLSAASAASNSGSGSGPDGGCEDGSGGDGRPPTLNRSDRAASSSAAASVACGIRYAADADHSGAWQEAGGRRGWVGGERGRDPKGALGQPPPHLRQEAGGERDWAAWM